MATNEFKPFATGVGANVTPQAEWETLPALLTGFQAGKASSAHVNKAIRQASFMAAALAQFIANQSESDVRDDGNITALVTSILSAINKTSQPLDATLTALAALATGANQIPYFTGTDTAGQTDLTQVGRDIIGKADIASVLTYLGLGDAATKNTGTTAGTVAAGNDSRITGAVQKTSNLSDLDNASEARKNLGLGSSATRDTEAFIPSTRKVNNKQLNSDVTLNASDVGAISSSGGNYTGYLRMTGIETLPTESAAANLSALYSSPTLQPGTVVSGMINNWYNYQIVSGAIRNAADGIMGYGVTINGVRRLLVTPEGDVYSNSDKLATESFFRQSFVQDVRLGSETTAPVSTHTAGLVLTAFDSVSGGVSTLYWRPLQKLINNQWITVGAI